MPRVQRKSVGRRFRRSVLFVFKHDAVAGLAAAETFEGVVHMGKRVRFGDRRDLVAGDRPLATGRDGALRVLHPPGTARDSRGNDASLVLLLDYGATSLLLTGDLEARAEASLLRRTGDPSATIVKVPHHGSRTSSTQALLAAARPGVAVAMLGADNRFGFPAPEVRARYRSVGAAWRQTDRDGAVAIVSDGQLERVTTCRASAER